MLIVVHITNVDLCVSDIRMVVGERFDPKSWARRSVNLLKWIEVWSIRWKYKIYIILLEILIAYMTSSWRTRCKWWIKWAFVHLMDNQSILSIFVKYTGHCRIMYRIGKLSTTILFIFDVKWICVYVEIVVRSTVERSK